MPNEKIGKYCSDHKLDNMIDVTHKLCHSEGCIIQPSFNFSDQISGIYCAKHKLDGMINIKNRKRDQLRKTEKIEKIENL